MARFFVGQRVRKVGIGLGRIPVGSEGRIAKILAGYETIDGAADCRVEWDDYSGHWWDDFPNLSPILPEHTPCESEFKESLDKLLSEVRETECEPARRDG